MKRIIAGGFCILPFLLHASTVESGPVTASMQQGYLGKFVQILEDSSAQMGVDQVIASGDFQRSNAFVPNLGISSSAYWVRVCIKNDTKYDHLILDLEHAEIEVVDLYLLKAGKATLIGATGQSRPSSTRGIAQPEFAFNLPIEIGDSATALFRLASSKQLQVPLKVYSALNFVPVTSVRDLRIGMYIGIMLALALYNIFIFLSIRDRTYVVYVVYIVFITLAQIAFWGVFQYYISSNYPWISVKSSIVFTFASAVAASEFMKRFIDTEKNVPRLHSGIKYFYGLFGIVIFLYLFINPSVGYQLAQIAAGLFAGYQFITILKVWRMGSRQAVFFLISWSVLLIGILVFTLKDMGVLPYNDFTVFIMPIGSAIEGILLSFGLADRINILRREKDFSQGEALRIAKENEQIILNQNVTLERKVTERTLALQASTDHLKRTQSQLVNAEKMAALGQLTAGIAHEINNPINFISSSIPPLKRDLSELREVLMAYRDARINGRDLEEVRLLEDRIGLEFNMKEVDEILLNLESGAQRTSEIVRGLRTFSRLDEYELKTVDVNEGIKSTLVVLAPQVRDAVAIELDLGELPLVECYAGKLNQVFMNLLNNAIFAVKQKHGAAGGKVRVVSYHTGEHAIFEIHDNGTGMDEATQHRLFEPFFTTKDVGEGTGLGMSIALSIIEDHNGTITVQSSPGEGSIFTLTMPISQQLLHAKRA
ncbi:MAG: 7TM diverse intracellular signaling domain-containing protein [Flavobacteriales bacterium]